MSEQGPVVLSGRYELHRRIARGGMAEVFLARDQLLERPVAVKILVPEFATDQSFVERFRREAQAAANLNHPNIVGVYDWGKEAGTHFIVMEYVDGRSLADILKAEGTVHPDRAADIATDVGAALGFAHRNGVVHRDVKPGNVLISRDGVVKVTDFGIARATTSGADANLTQTGSVMGTATYFSPEQAQGRPVDPRSDLYSLGVVMYEMVCGRPPFQGDSPVAIAYKHVQEQPVPPRHLNTAIPPAYEAITMKLLAKNPANRYASAEDLRADLRRFREGRPVQAEGILDPPVGATAAVAGVGATRATRAATSTMAGDGAMLPPSNRFDEPPRRRGGVFLVAAIALLALLGVGLFVLARSLGVGGSDKVKVPDVRKQSILAATNQLKNAGFTVATDIERVYDDSVGKDLVIRTDPPTGKAVAKGSSIKLVVSAGHEIKIPDGIEGLSLDDAVNRLEAAGLSSDQIDQIGQANDEVDANVVMSVDPTSGSVVPPGGTVKLTYSTGTNKTVPSIPVGSDQDAAVSALTSAGYHVQLNYEYSPTVPQGKVIRLDPAGGTKLKPGETVVVVISNGVEPTTTTSSTTTSTTSTTTPGSSSTTSTTTP
ncbi:MAG TPA: Stk1 family PASTA domain-containing Ser/Thr kinase [Acidimicrobiales bacterium]|jgi:serine/threonine-protein kinase|nr:Stk1 family PASTA domain-containing Ser/Thr kinase [Acidimicrobiales bacterium]